MRKPSYYSKEGGVFNAPYTDFASMFVFLNVLIHVACDSDWRIHLVKFGRPATISSPLWLFQMTFSCP